MVSEGIIHSTDNVIERMGDYNEFFRKMNENKDFKPLSQAHSKNLNEAVTSMKSGISPVVVDNTNIKMNEAKGYVKAALMMGYSDLNIKFVDVGTSGLTAEELVKRNTHGVPLEKIKQMMESYKGQGEITLKKVLDSKDMYPSSDVLYSCVLLDNASYKALLIPDNYNYVEPEDGWVIYAHHMTINLGPLKDKTELGKKVQLTVNKVGKSDKALAVAVSGYHSLNKIPHVTIAVNPDGGKPKDSNDITKWQDIKPFIISGVVTEIKRNEK